MNQKYKNYSNIMLFYLIYLDGTFKNKNIQKLHIIMHLLKLYPICNPILLIFLFHLLIFFTNHIFLIIKAMKLLYYKHNYHKYQIKY